MGEDRKDEKQGQGFKVSDRRKRFEAEEAAAPEAVKTPPAEPPPQAAAGPKGAAAPESEMPGPEEMHGELGPPGPADIVQLFGILARDAVVLMGLHDDPRSGQSFKNLPMASWHIDMLKVLRDKTTGNLSKEEEGLLNQTVAQLQEMFARTSDTSGH